jgi:hypothetical protein
MKKIINFINSIFNKDLTEKEYQQILQYVESVKGVDLRGAKP